MASRKKDFSNVNNDQVYQAIDQATAKRQPAGPEERARRQKEGRTQGRAGCRLQRISIGFSDDNYSFIQVMSKASGRSMSQFCDSVMTAYRKEHPEIAKQAEFFVDLINETAFKDLD